MVMNMHDMCMPFKCLDFMNGAWIIAKCMDYKGGKIFLLQPRKRVCSYKLKVYGFLKKKSHFETKIFSDHYEKKEI